jgi:hypothetical protein
MLCLLVAAVRNHDHYHHDHDVPEGLGLCLNPHNLEYGTGLEWSITC